MIVLPQVRTTPVGKNKSYPQWLALVDNFCFSGVLFLSTCLNSACLCVFGRVDKSRVTPGILLVIASLFSKETIDQPEDNNTTETWIGFCGVSRFVLKVLKGLTGYP